MKLSPSIALPALVAACLVAGPAQAETQVRRSTTPAARLCTLSIPTTDTKARPKATGFRNEGTTNAFVICAFDSSPGQPDTDPLEVPWDLRAVELNFASIDGKPHGFDCTAVNSWDDGGAGFSAPMQYIAKKVQLTGSLFSTVRWIAADFGGSTTIPTSGIFSVTCLLPPGAAIQFGLANAQEDIGN